VLKWYETKGLSIDRYWCGMEAAEYGHLNILKWLKEEKDLELDGKFYENAIDGDFAAGGGGQLLVMKWLREQEVDWPDEYTFYLAALEENLEILQWLHDEGCPWPEDDDCRVREDRAKPEVIEWLYANGYGDRISDYPY